MPTSLEVYDGQETLDHVKLSTKFSYVIYPSCPYQFNSFKPTFLSAVAFQKTKHVNHVGNREIKINRTISDNRKCLNPNNDHPRIQEISHCGWYRTVYEIPNNIIIKVEVTQQNKGMGSTLDKAIIYLRMRESAAWTKIKYKSGYGLESIVNGRFDILSMEQIQALRINYPMGDTAFMSEVKRARFLDVEIIQPALKEIQTHKEELTVDGQTFKINKPKFSKKVERF